MSTECLLCERRTVFSRFSRSQKAGVAAAFLSGLLLGFQTLVEAQEPGKAKPVAYEKYDISELLKDKDGSIRKEKHRIKGEMLRGAVAYNKQEVDSYYKNFLLPRLTYVDAPEQGNAARAEIFGDIERAEKAPEAVLAEFNALLFTEARKIAEGNYQPSASIIATQILSSLNKSRPRGLAPEPLISAVGPLLGLCTNGKNDGIRAAALRGLERQIEYYGAGWPDANRQKLAELLLASLKAPRPVGRSDRSDAWIRGRTLELLLKIKHSKEADVYQYAIDVLANPKSDPILIEKAMLVTGQYPKSEVPANMANSIAGTPLKLLVSRINTWKKEVGELQFSGGGGDPDASTGAPEDDSTMVDDTGAGDEGFGGKKAKKKAEPKVNPYAKQSADVINKRRALHETLEIIRYGFTGSRIGPIPTELKSGVAQLVPEGESQEVIIEVLTALKDLQDAINSPTITDRLSLATEATPKMEALLGLVDFFLNNLTQPTQAPPADPVAAPAQGSVTTIVP